MDSIDDELELSQLADGELDADHAGRVLLSALEDPGRRDSLRRLLKLRLLTAPWRGQEAPAMNLGFTAPGKRLGRLRRLGRIGQVALAAAVGGVLVLAGLWLGRGRVPSPAPSAGEAVALTPQERQRITDVFRFHESVAGPLSWYAADDRQVQLAGLETPAGEQEALAIVLRIAPALGKGQARTVVLVCRNGQQASVDLPAEPNGLPALRLRLVPSRHNGVIEAQYALAVGGPGEGPVLATLAGERTLGPTGAALGQLPWQDRLLSVAASAWVIRTEQ